MSIKQMRAGVKSENWQKATKTMFFVVFLWGAGTPLLVELFFWAIKASTCERYQPRASPQAHTNKTNK